MSPYYVQQHREQLFDELNVALRLRSRRTYRNGYQTIVNWQKMRNLVCPALSSPALSSAIVLSCIFKPCNCHVDETKVMASDGIAYRVLIQNEQLVDTFLYLGSLITEDGEFTTEFRTRLNRGQAIGAPLQKIWRSHGIPISTKIQLMKALVWHVATYGCESWTLRKNEETRLDAFEMKGLRKILRASWTAKKTNEWELNKAGVKKELLDTVKARNLAYTMVTP